MTRTLVPPLLIVFLAACETAGGSDDATGDTDVVGTTSSADATTAMTTMTTMTAGTIPTTGDPTSGTSDESVSDESAPPGSELANCRELHEDDPSAPDGVYEFYPAGDPDLEPFDAYCDMTTDGGGWTLVGRSVAGEWEGEFGWNWATGSADNNDLPYSLGATDAELDVTEILFGSRMAGKNWGPDVYKMVAPDLYVFAYRQAPYFGEVQTVVGECSPKNGPHHLQYHGWTDDSVRFRFIQYEFDSATGLSASGFATSHDDCDGGGNLNGMQGMVMAR